MFTLLHTESSKGWGGQENRTLQEAIGLKKLGVRVLILCQPGARLATRAKEAGIEVYSCPIRQSYDITGIRFILKLIKSEHIDIISTHSGKDSLIGALAGRFSKNKPAIVRTRHLALPITSRISYRRLPHKIVTVSEYVRQYLIGEGISSDKVVSISTGVDLERFNPHKVKGRLRQELGLSPDIPLVGTIGILRRKKGHHILLEAIPMVLKEIPAALFIFAGNGPQKENLTNKIKGAGLGDKVILLGLRQDIPDILNSLDVFALPTLQEALGTSFIEAMAMEKPVIGTDVGGVKEVIKEGINGHLVEANNPSALADKIVRLLRDKGKARLMGIEGRKIVEQNFTIKKMCAGMHELYTSLLSIR